MSKDEMNPAQRQALCKAWDLLTEHFDRVLLVTDWEVEGENGARQDAHEGNWHGGSLSAVGMAEFAKDRILGSGKKSNEPTDE